MGIKKIKDKIKISDNITISKNSECFIVAEISANHSGSLGILKKLCLRQSKLEQVLLKFKLTKQIQ